MFLLINFLFYLYFFWVNGHPTVLLLLILLFINLSLGEVFYNIYLYINESASSSFIRFCYVRYYLIKVLNCLLELVGKLIWTGTTGENNENQEDRSNRDEYLKFNNIYIKPLFNDFNRNNKIELMYNLHEKVDQLMYWRFRNGEMYKLACKYSRNNIKFDFFKLDGTVTTRFTELLSPLTLNFFKTTSKEIYYHVLNQRGIEVSYLLFYSPSLQSFNHPSTAHKLK